MTEAKEPVARPAVSYFEFLAAPIQKSGQRAKQHAEIRLTRNRAKGMTWRIDLRLWVLDPSGEMRPTTRGISFDADKLLALRDALIEGCRRMKLEDD